MARAKRTPIDPKQLQGFKRLRHLLPLLAELRPAGCERDTAGNRTLHFDEYVTWVLLWMFNPLVDSMRGLQQASGLEKVADKLGVGRFSLGSFSESVRVFDPALLQPIIHDLAGSLNPVGHDPRLASVQRTLVAVDGTVLDAIAKVSGAWWLNFQDGTPKHAWRLHTHFDILRWFPVDLELTEARCSGKSDEKAVLRRKLQSDHCYLTDRWFAQFTLFNEINAIGSSYVCRMKENSAYDVVEERLLSDEALAAGIVRDAVVTMGASSKPAERPDHPIRLVVIEAEAHEKRGGRKGKTAGPGTKGLIVIASNLLEAPAELIALLYRYRYAIEIFFRFLKQILGCRHLISQKPEGVMIQMCCAVIACLLINLWTGVKPTKRSVEMMGFYFLGLATDNDLRRHIAGLQKTKA
jgi:hypothetical protein